MGLTYHPNPDYLQMVACDYPQCKREWVGHVPSNEVFCHTHDLVLQFHLDCVGLTELPQSQTWYCRDCEPLVRKGEFLGPRKRGR